jgi:hypothetical protein
MPRAAPTRPPAGQPSPARTPPLVIQAQLQHPRLHLGVHLVRTRPRPARPVGQVRHPTRRRIPPQPPMQRLPRNPEPGRHLRHSRAVVEDLHHRPIPLLHHSQLHQHREHRLPDQPLKGTLVPTRPGARETSRRVAQVPELCRAPTGTASPTCHLGTGTPVSTMNRSRTETLPSAFLSREASDGPERRGDVASPQVDGVRHQGLEPRTR